MVTALHQRLSGGSRQALRLAWAPLLCCSTITNLPHAAQPLCPKLSHLLLQVVCWHWQYASWQGAHVESHGSLRMAHSAKPSVINKPASLCSSFT